eukprot:gene28407-37344_t
MLAANRLPELLQDNLTDGVEGLCLMTDSGTILGSAILKNSSVNETGLAAISSSVWTSQNEGPEIRFHLIKYENGYLGITSASRGYLIAGFGKNVPAGLLKGRLEVLRLYFSKVFEQIN